MAAPGVSEASARQIVGFDHGPDDNLNRRRSAVLMNFAICNAIIAARCNSALFGHDQMCDLKDLDVQSRAAVSLVAAWQGEHQAIRTIWKLEDVVQLLLRAIAGARELRASLQHGNPTADDETLRRNATYFLETVKRIGAGASDAIRIIEMFESEGYSVDFADDIRHGATAITDIQIETEALCERLEWQVLEKTALPSAMIRAVAAHLASTGQASA